MPPDPSHHDVRSAFQREIISPHLWATRAVVVSTAALAGLVVVGFTWLAETAFALFRGIEALAWWLPLAWTPLCCAAVVWATRRYARGAAGSGIPQVMAALDPALSGGRRPLLVSLRLSMAKIGLTSAGLLGGLSLGREGPSVQIAAGVMLGARRWLPRGSGVSAHSLLVAGGAAGIAAAFNTPLAGVMFAIEELSRSPEQRNSGLIVAGIVLAGLIAVSVHGNGTHFGVIHPGPIGLALLWPGLLAALASGCAGGLFARLLLSSLRGQSPDAPSRWRARHPVWFAAGCGLLVALIGVLSSWFIDVYRRVRACMASSSARVRSRSTELTRSSSAVCTCSRCSARCRSDTSSTTPIPPTTSPSGSRSGAYRTVTQSWEPSGWR